MDSQLLKPSILVDPGNSFIAPDPLSSPSCPPPRYLSWCLLGCLPALPPVLTLLGSHRSLQMFPSSLALPRSHCLALGMRFSQSSSSLIERSSFFGSQALHSSPEQIYYMLLCPQASLWSCKSALLKGLCSWPSILQLCLVLLKTPSSGVNSSGTSRATLSPTPYLLAPDTPHSCLHCQWP